MKAIIIQDQDARALLDQLKLEAFHPTSYHTGQERLTPQELKVVTEEVHRRFHYIVCRWLQEQGASVVR